MLIWSTHVSKKCTKVYENPQFHNHLDGAGMILILGVLGNEEYASQRRLCDSIRLSASRERLCMFEVTLWAESGKSNWTLCKSVKRLWYLTMKLLSILFSSLVLHIINLSAASSACKYQSKIKMLWFGHFQLRKGNWSWLERGDGLKYLVWHGPLLSQDYSSGLLLRNFSVTLYFHQKNVHCHEYNRM